jgi:hypothetical protein
MEVTTLVTTAREVTNAISGKLQYLAQFSSGAQVGIRAVEQGRIAHLVLLEWTAKTSK